MESPPSPKEESNIIHFESEKECIAENKNEDALVVESPPSPKEENIPHFETEKEYIVSRLLRVHMISPSQELKCLICLEYLGFVLSSDLKLDILVYIL